MKANFDLSEIRGSRELLQIFWTAKGYFGRIRSISSVTSNWNHLWVLDYFIFIK
jgi:hypothetical protein